jgi:mRNA-degrading endonuclease toxin of MazEF toxin-antitoxin module
VRPALIISSNAFNSAFHDVLVMGITSNLTGVPPGVEFDNADLDSGQIPHRSKIVVSKLYSLDQRILLACRCKISDAVFQTALAELDRILGRNLTE